MNWNAKWIMPAEDMGDVAPLFLKEFAVTKEIRSAMLHVTALGVYEAKINGQRVSRYVLAPGWTSYWQRLQYQSYDVTELLQQQNSLQILVGKGWYRSPLSGDAQRELMENPCGLLAQLEICYADGSCQQIGTDDSWLSGESPVRFSEIYDGEVYDSRVEPSFDRKTAVFDGPSHTLIPQEGEQILEQEVICAARILTTPKGETVVDFGQEVTGYVEFRVEAEAGQEVRFLHGEMLDGEGNFYNENYRKAKAVCHYICRDGVQTYHSLLTFYGFRYIKLEAFPGGVTAAKAEQFRAIVVYSDLKQTGSVSCSNPKLNQLFRNIFWGQKGNFLDVPTDCPQRDERLGWTGDAQVFVKAAALNFDVEKFFRKWLADLAASQREDGYVGAVIPDTLRREYCSFAWGDATTICPWEIYLAYGDKDILKRQYASMKKFLSYITINTRTQGLWDFGTQFGDWLGLDAPTGSYKGSSDETLLATAFYAYSTSIVIKAGKLLGEDVAYYEALYEKIVQTFRKTFPVFKTQTECVVAAHFRVAEDCQKTADRLVELIGSCGGHLQTGFVGTPYLLHVLSDYGYKELAYTLLLREAYPSWLYSVNRGATTMWEHWDGVDEQGRFWSKDMNSFNHYAYGAVIDWVYTKAAGIQNAEGSAGYETMRIAPLTDPRLDWLDVSLQTRKGTVRVRWEKQENFWRYDIVTPVSTQIVIGDIGQQVEPGRYSFFVPLCENA